MLTNTKVSTSCSSDFSDKAEGNRDCRRSYCQCSNSKISSLLHKRNRYSILISFTDITMFFKSSYRQIPSHSRISSGRLSKSDRPIFAKVQSAQIALMDLSRMVTPRGWRGPSKNLIAAIGYDRHRVSNLNFTHVIPANKVSSGGVNDFYSFIKEDDFGFVHNQTHTTGKTNSPSKSYSASSKIARKESLQIHSSQQNQQNKESNNTRFTSKSFWITTWQNFGFHIAVSLHKLGRQSV